MKHKYEISINKQANLFMCSVFLPPCGGESRDLKTKTMADTIENPAVQVVLSLIFPLIQIRLAWGLEQIPRKMTATCHRMRLSDKDLVKKLLTSNRKIRLLINNFLTRS